MQGNSSRHELMRGHLYQHKLDIRSAAAGERTTKAIVCVSFSVVDSPELFLGEAGDPEIVSW